MKRKVSWAVYVTALLMGSSLAVLAEARDAATTAVRCASGCAATDCTICVPNGCELEWWEHTHLMGTLPGKRCVEWDGIPPAHCAWVSVTSYQVFNLLDHYVRDCETSVCSTGEWTTETCSNPWKAPEGPGKP